jgi:hypothetical protein
MKPGRDSKVLSVLLNRVPPDSHSGQLCMLAYSLIFAQTVLFSLTVDDGVI